MGEIVPFKIEERDLVKALEDWTERARKGEITALAFAAVMEDGSTYEGWSGNYGSCVITLYGAINILRDQYFHLKIEHYDRSSI
jgi:hypothetical protein